MSTMFERLGGAAGIERAIASFQARLAKDGLVTSLSADASQESAFMGWVFGAAAEGGSHPAAAGLIPDVTNPNRQLVIDHLRAALLEVGVEAEIAEEALVLLERATRASSGLPFDLVVVETGGVRAEHSPEEFLAIPLKARAQLVLARAVSFFSKGEPVDRKVALGALRTASVAKLTSP